MATLIPIPVPSDYSDEADVPSVLDDMAQAITINLTNINDEIGNIGEALDILNGEVIS